MARAGRQNLCFHPFLDIPLPGMPTRDLERVGQLVQRRSVAAGASVLTTEQPGEAVYVLLEASVKVHLFTPGLR